MPFNRQTQTRNSGVTGTGGTPRYRSALATLSAILAVSAIMTIAVAGAASSTPAVTRPAKSVPPPANWRLAFSTDFPGTTLDTATWDECYPWEASPQGCTNFGNPSEREWYLPSQVSVRNGMLALVAQRTPTNGYDASGNPKTYNCRSGMVTTYPGMRLQYGFVQVIARIPFGTGLWPAIWLAPADWSWPPEIDVVEHWNTSLTARATLHPKSGRPLAGIVKFPNADKGWHSYTLYWTQSRLSVYFDSKLVLTTTTGVPQQQMYLLLDLADENDSPGGCSGTMYVRSVKVWQPQ
jgi:beta-glucanase (GH16 family)